MALRRNASIQLALMDIGLAKPYKTSHVKKRRKKPAWISVNIISPSTPKLMRVMSDHLLCKCWLQFLEEAGGTHVGSVRTAPAPLLCRGESWMQHVLGTACSSQESRSFIWHLSLSEQTAAVLPTQHLSLTPADGHAPASISHIPGALTWWKKVSHRLSRSGLTGSHSPLLYFNVSRSNFTKATEGTNWERGNRTPPSISFSGLEMLILNLGDSELEEKVESVSEETRNMLGRK